MAVLVNCIKMEESNSVFFRIFCLVSKAVEPNILKTTELM